MNISTRVDENSLRLFTPTQSAIPTQSCMPALHGSTTSWLALRLTPRHPPPFFLLLLHPALSTSFSQDALPQIPPTRSSGPYKYTHPVCIAHGSEQMHAVCCAVHYVVSVGLISCWCYCLLCGWILASRSSGDIQAQLPFKLTVTALVHQQKMASTRQFCFSVLPTNH